MIDVFKIINIKRGTLRYVRYDFLLADLYLCLYVCVCMLLCFSMGLAA